MELIVPPVDELYPTLGDQIIEFLLERACHGPGDLKGQRLRLDEDWRFWLYRAYEVWPRGHEDAGRRRFKRCAASVRKGASKTELMALVAFVELHPEAPARFDGFNRNGSLKPGRPVVDPYIPLLSNTKDQVEELAYGALRVICEECVDADLFDVSLERVIRLDSRGKADGKCVPLAGAPNARDGARTTFQGYDETHRLYLPNHKAAVQTMESNLGKRYAQDPWSMSTTTAGEPGQQSQAEDDHFEAEAISRGEVQRPSLFYFHRQASDGWDMDSFEDRRKAIIEASGPELSERTDVKEIASRWDRPKADKTYLERVWTNRWTAQGAQAFDVKKWKTLARPDLQIPRGAFVAFGFDGARFRDAAGVTLTDVRTGLQQPYWLSEKPLNDDDYEVDENALTAAVLELRKHYRVLLGYCDPAYFETTVGGWSLKFGESRFTKRAIVQEFWTNAHGLNRTIKAVKSYTTAINTGSVTYFDTVRGVPTEHGDLTRHVGNAGRKNLGNRLDIETGEPVYILGKLHRDRKFDLAMSGMLSWEARMDALPFLPKRRGRIQRVR